MKRLNEITLLLICMLFLFSGCGQSAHVTNKIPQHSDVIEESTYVINNFSDASMNIIESTVTSKGLTVEFTYNGNNTGQYGSWYTVEIDNNGQWVTLPYANYKEEEIGWTSEAYPVAVGETRSAAITWAWLYDELPSGHYRIIKGFMDFRGTGDYTNYYLSDEFVIK